MLTRSRAILDHLKLGSAEFFLASRLRVGILSLRPSQTTRRTSRAVKARDLDGLASGVTCAQGLKRRALRSGLVRPFHLHTLISSLWLSLTTGITDGERPC